MSLEDYNLANDHRVAALGEKPWYLDHDGGLVVVRVPTADYHWLATEGFDPEEFAEGGIKPLDYGCQVKTGQNCWRCEGMGEIYRFVRWPGCTAKSREQLLKSYPHHETRPSRKMGVEREPEEIEVVTCYERCCQDGKRTTYQEYEDGPRLYPGAEDRVYRPFKAYVFPCKLVDCPTCRGKGKHVNPSIDAGGLTSEDFDRDPGFRAAYFGGSYDVSCYGCDGKRKVPAIDVRELHDEDRPVYERWKAWYDEQQADAEADRRERAAELRHGW